MSLGEVCTPYTLIKSSVIDGEIVNVTKEVCGRKISLDDIRKKLLKKHEKFMRLQTDEEIESLDLQEVKRKLTNTTICSKNISTNTSFNSLA